MREVDLVARRIECADDRRAYKIVLQRSAGYAADDASLTNAQYEHTMSASMCPVHDWDRFVVK